MDHWCTGIDWRPLSSAPSSPSVSIGDISAWAGTYLAATLLSTACWLSRAHNPCDRAEWQYLRGHDQQGPDKPRSKGSWWWRVWGWGADLAPQQHESDISQCPGGRSDGTTGGMDGLPLVPQHAPLSLTASLPGPGGQKRQQCTALPAAETWEKEESFTSTKYNVVFTPWIHNNLYSCEEFMTSSQSSPLIGGSGLSVCGPGGILVGTPPIHPTCPNAGLHLCQFHYKQSNFTIYSSEPFNFQPPFSTDGGCAVWISVVVKENTRYLTCHWIK